MLYEIAIQAAVLTDAEFGVVFVAEGDRFKQYVNSPGGAPATLDLSRVEASLEVDVVRSGVAANYDDEIATLQTFAVRAGSAVTHARLLADIEQRNAELAESLELRTTTSAILELTALGCILP